MHTYTLHEYLYKLHNMLHIASLVLGLWVHFGHWLNNYVNTANTGTGSGQPPRLSQNCPVWGWRLSDRAKQIHYTFMHSVCVHICGLSNTVANSKTGLHLCVILIHYHRSLVCQGVSLGLSQSRCRCRQCRSLPLTMNSRIWQPHSWIIDKSKDQRCTAFGGFWWALMILNASTRNI